VTPRTPRVRVVVLNHEGGEMTVRCLTALRELDWPQESLDVVLVDNASHDGIAEVVGRDMPWVRVMVSPRNLGFAGGCNLAMRDLRDLDYVALLNNDAIPDRSWLRPLVEALEADDGLGAASSKILFAPAFVSVRLEAPPGAAVTVTGVEVDGTDVWEHTQFGNSSVTRGSGAEHAVRAEADAEIRVPVDPSGPLPDGVTLELADRSRVVVPVEGPAFDVINNAGSRLEAAGYGADRGLLERDCGQYDKPEEVFAWCGGAALLSARYLRDVGIFDDRYFIYYEDTDLAWRGRLAGWRYAYVPTSVVRHEHAASSEEGSALFFHYVERNRFLTLARNAPWSMLLRAAYVFNRDTLVLVKRDVLVPMLLGKRSSSTRVRQRLRAFAAFLALLPHAIVTRRRQRVSRVARAELVRQWAE
jgi:GT2 family glycosyltransferase